MNILRVHCAVAAVGEGFLFKGKGPHGFQLDGKSALVVGPIALPPELRRKASGLVITVSDRVVKPASGLSGAVDERRPQFQRAEQAQSDAHVIAGGKGSDSGDFLDIIILVRSQAPFCARLQSVLAEEFIKRDDQLPVASLSRLLADLPQTAVLLFQAGGQIDPFVWVLQIVQLLVAGQNDRCRPCPFSAAQPEADHRRGQQFGGKSAPTGDR